MSDDKRTADARPLKLFVVGESSGDPAEWSEWPDRVFVMARDGDEALATCGYSAEIHGEAREVVADEPTILFHDERGLVDRMTR